MPFKPLIQQICDTSIEIEHAPNGRALELEPAGAAALDQDVRDYLTCDKYVKTYEEKRELCKQRIIARIGTTVAAIVHRGRKKKLRLFLNRFIYNLTTLHERLGRDNQDIYDRVVGTGAPGRIVVACNLETRSETLSKLIDILQREFDPGSKLESYESTKLEVLLDEQTLFQDCRDRQINLAGTRTPVVNILIYDLDSKPR